MSKKWRLEFEAALKEMRRANPQIIASAIVRTDGLVLASELPRNADEGIVSAMSAAVLNIGNRSVNELNRGKLDKVIISGSKGDIVICGVGDIALLSAITNPDSNLGLVILEMRRASDKIKEILKQI
ncbi:MAG: roadblock/LC7 domain-containing protein [Candidatus Jordarchaeum sp.]|uniref:roadblock/LC7 domain-containing protein n=1 Tax=Candidatus Jordarchaeum sp. TaxID=2823881 RepID=UPI004048F120